MSENAAAKASSGPSRPERIWTIGQLLKWAGGYLGQKGFTKPRLEAEILLGHVLGLDRVRLYLDFERPLMAGELAAYKVCLKRRAACEPSAYITGIKEFYGLQFKVGPGILIPRPETELLVDEALRWALRLGPRDAELALADIGLGSGAIGAALLHNLPQSRLWGVDISPRALKTAAENFDRLGLGSRATLCLGDLLEPVTGHKFHLIGANLPYIPTPEMASLMPDVGRYEPRLALDGGPDGLSLIEPLVRAAPYCLRSNGALFLEIWPESWPALDRLAKDSGFKGRRVLNDLAGLRRVAVLGLRTDS